MTDEFHCAPAPDSRDEFNHSHLEYTASHQEYGSVGEECFPLGQEYPDAGPENHISGDEFHSSQPYEPSGDAARQENEKRHSFIRRAGYLVAAAAATVIIIETTDIPQKPDAVDPVNSELVADTDDPEPVDTTDPQTPVDVATADYGFLKPYLDEIYSMIRQDHYFALSEYINKQTQVLYEELEDYPGTADLIYTADGVYEAEDGQTDYLMRVTYRNTGEKLNSAGSSLEFQFFTADSFTSGQYPNSRIVYCDGMLVQALRGDFTGTDCADARYEEFWYQGSGQIYPVYYITGSVENGHFTGSVTENTYAHNPITIRSDQHTLNDIAYAAHRFFDLDANGCLYLPNLTYLSSEDGHYAFEVFQDTDYRYFLEYNSFNDSWSLCVREFPEHPEANNIYYACYTVNGDTTDELFPIVPLTEMLTF